MSVRLRMKGIKRLWCVAFVMNLWMVVTGLDNGLALTPPMGWLAWERFRCNTDCQEDPENCISEKLFKEMADIMVSEGYLALGYQYIIMDDCWLERNRSSTGQLQADKDRFPQGIAALSDYVHKLGLKFGIYEDYGTKTCAGYPGIIGHLEQDAKTFASWGVDYVKLDGCHSDPKDMDQGFPAFGAALAATRRPMVYSCEWPLYQQSHGIKPNYTSIKKYCNLWRNYRDVQDNWDNVLNIINHFGDDANDFLRHGGPGGWNDPDMLVVGNFGLSFDQARAQMAVWAVLAAPLLMSVDLRDIRPEFKSLLQHRGVIKINQDPLGAPGFRVLRRKHVDFFVRPVMPTLGIKTSFALAILDTWGGGGTPTIVAVTLRALRIKNHEAYQVTDVFTGEWLGTFGLDDEIKVKVNPTGVRLLKLNILQSNQGKQKTTKDDEGFSVFTLITRLLYTYFKL